MKLKDILILEYSDKTITTTIDRWKKTNPSIDDNLAKQVIQRFDQVKSGLSSKLTQIALSDELKQGQNYLNIDKYSWDDMVKLLRSLPEKDDKVKKDAIQMFVEKERMDKGDVTSYVIRFMNNRRNLKYALDNGTEDGNYTKDEVKKLVPQRLLMNNAYLDPRSWNFGQMEQMLDTLFPMQAKAGEGEEINTATVDADKIYDKDGIEIYKGDAQHKCIAYNPTEGGKKKYGWCIAQPTNTMYDRYRFMEEGKNRMFYFVFDRNLPESNPYHAFVIHVGEGNKRYWITDAKNSGDQEFKQWSDLKSISPEVYNRIGKLEEHFKFLAPSKAEISGAAMRGKKLSPNDFRELDYEDKQNYVQANAGSLSPDILKVLDKELKNLAINYGQKFPYADLKDNESLAKRYAIFRFRHTNYAKDPIPLPYVKYLDDEAKQKYLDTFDDNLNYEYIDKYFGPKATENYVQQQIKNLDYLPKDAIKYIKDPKQKAIFSIYNKLFDSWEFGSNFGVDEEQLENMADMPEQDVTPKPITAKQWNDFSPEERKALIKLAEQVNGKDQYSTLLYALPYIINDNGKKLILLPLKNDDYSYDKWVLVDEANKVIKKDIDGDKYTIGGQPLVLGFPNIEEDPRRVYDIDELKSEGKINEVKINKPFSWGKLVNPKDLKPGDILIDYNDDKSILIGAAPWEERNKLKKYDAWYGIDEMEENPDDYDIDKNTWLVITKREGVRDPIIYNYGYDGAYKEKNSNSLEDEDETFEEQYLRERLMHRAGLR